MLIHIGLSSSMHLPLGNHMPVMKQVRPRLQFSDFTFFNLHLPLNLQITDFTFFHLHLPHIFTATTVFAVVLNAAITA